MVVFSIQPREKKKNKMFSISLGVLNSSRSRLGECQSLLVSRNKQGFHECGVGKVYLLLSAGSKKRGSPSAVSP